MANYEIKGIYQGGPSTFKPYNTAKNFSMGTLGETTNPRSINIIKEVSEKLSSGTKHIEVEGVSSEIFDAIPQPFFKEVDRLSKLTGINVSVHGPVINVSGLDPRSGYSEAEREIAEKKVASALIRSHDINPNGNIPVNFHSGEGIPASDWHAPDKQGKIKPRKLLVVDRDSGRMAPLEEETLYYPNMKEIDEKVYNSLSPSQRKEIDLTGKIPPELKGLIKDVPLQKGKIFTPEKRLESLNATSWDNSIDQLIFNKERADEILNKYRPLIEPFLEKRKDITPETLEKFPDLEKAFFHYHNAETYLEDVHDQLRTRFSKAYEYGDEKQRKMLSVLSDEFKKDLNKNPGSIYNQSRAMNRLLIGLKDRDLAPNINVPIEDFALEKSSQTFGNAAFESFKKFKNKSPTLVIENPPAGFVLSRGEDIVNIVKKSREQFVKNAVDSKTLSKAEAEKAAEKLIGATWDLGHINMMRKYGWSEKDIIKETEKVAPYIKHVHLSDNFGLEHTELPMGMGNVPMKQMMEKLGKKGEEAAKIIEAGQWWNEFRTSPFIYAVQGVGAPIFNTGVAPYWNQAPGFQQDYFGGYGFMLPQINYETFGAGFSQLPGELGGQKQSTPGSRMSGRGME